MTAAKNSPKAVKETTVRKYGGSLGVTLPKGMIEELDLSEGDRVFIRRTDEGILVSPYDPDFAEFVDAAEEFVKQYQNTLRELAK